MLAPTKHFGTKSKCWSLFGAWAWEWIISIATMGWLACASATCYILPCHITLYHIYLSIYTYMGTLVWLWGEIDICLWCTCTRAKKKATPFQRHTNAPLLGVIRHYLCQRASVHMHMHIYITNYFHYILYTKVNFSFPIAHIQAVLRPFCDICVRAARSIYIYLLYTNTAMQNWGHTTCTQFTLHMHGDCVVHCAKCLKMCWSVVIQTAPATKQTIDIKTTYYFIIIYLYLYSH